METLETYFIKKKIKKLKKSLGVVRGDVGSLGLFRERIKTLEVNIKKIDKQLQEDRKLIEFIFDGDDQLIKDILNNKRKNWKEQTEAGKPDLFTKDFTREDTIDFTRDFARAEMAAATPIVIVDVSKPPTFEVMAGENEDSKDWDKPIVKKDSEDKFNIPDES